MFCPNELNGSVSRKIAKSIECRSGKSIKRRSNNPFHLFITLTKSSNKSFNRILAFNINRHPTFNANALDVIPQKICHVLIECHRCIISHLFIPIAKSSNKGFNHAPTSNIAKCPSRICLHLCILIPKSRNKSFNPLPIANVAKCQSNIHPPIVIFNYKSSNKSFNRGLTSNLTKS